MTLQPFNLKKYWPITLLLLVALALRIVHAATPEIVSWDGSVYAGMAKFLYSGGQIGGWEILRPPLWPVLLGAFWKIGVDPYIAGIVLEVVFSLGLILVVYVIGEKIKRNAGLIAATLIAFIPILFLYSGIPMTDIPSTFLAVLALWLILAKKNNWSIFFAGVCVGLSMLMRFPQGLMLVVTGGVLIISAWQGAIRTIFWKRFFIETLYLGAGFALIIIPYLCINAVIYGNAFLPFIEGSKIINHYPDLYHKGFWFYFKSLFDQHVVLALAGIPLVQFFRGKLTKQQLVVVVAALIYFGYFLYEPHKEIRYMIGFLPYIALCAGLGTAYLIEKMRMPIVALFLLLLGWGTYTNIRQVSAQTADAPIIQAYASFFSHTPGAEILSSAPFPMRYGNVLLVDTLYDGWGTALKKYLDHRESVEYVAIDSCVLEIGCEGDTMCVEGKEELLNTLEADGDLVFSGQQGICDMRIYKLP